MLVSQVFFAMDLNEEHGMHDYYKSLPDIGARLKVAITGIDRDGLYMVSVKQRYDGVFQWLGEYTTNQEVVQKYCAAKSTRDARQAMCEQSPSNTGPPS